MCEVRLCHLSIEVRPFVLTLGVPRFNIFSLSQVEENYKRKVGEAILEVHCGWLEAAQGSHRRYVSAVKLCLNMKKI